jgi:hypothetical protein
MLSSNGESASGLSPSAGAQGTSTHGTLPPPEWTSPKTEERSPATLAPKPLRRRTGERAEEAWLRARVQEARATGDRDSMRAACVALARWLASRDRDLDEAVDLAASALQSEKDDAADLELADLRRELSSWLEGLGEPARAASVLKPLPAQAQVESIDAALVFVRMGVLKARAGDAAAAAGAFEAALSIDDTDPVPGELIGTLSAWQPEAVPAANAVEAYIESARRHSALKQEDAELVDLWRALAVAPASDEAASALSDALERRGRAGAADDVLRAHAQMLSSTDPVGAARVHNRRRIGAMRARETARALGAALDEGLASQLHGEGSDAFDAILLDLGMLETLAARIDLRAQRSDDPNERAAQFVQLARLHAGPLADPKRAIHDYVAAVAADSRCEEATLALSSHVAARGGGEDELRALLASVAAVADEGDRRVLLVARLRRLTEAHGGQSVPAQAEREPETSAWIRDLVDGGARAQASALEGLAASESAPAVRAVLLAGAADRSLSTGNATTARTQAELATRADPTHARCVATLADAALAQHRDRHAADALERAIGVIGPRVSWCAALADTLDILGETELAAGWSQRCVALRPGDREAIRLLLDRLLRAGDGSRVRDALAWLLTQPQPVRWTADVVAGALSELARADADRALVVARRALDVFGPKESALREAMLGVAERASDDAFAVAILERWLSCGADGSDRRQLLLRLADLRRRLGDDEGEARALARAVHEGFGGAETDPRIVPLPDAAVSADTQLWRMRAAAQRLSAGDDTEAAIAAWRELGAALWDLADDHVGAVDAWQRAARLTPGGYATLALDLAAFAGAAFAFKYLARVVETEPDDPTSATIAADVARAALFLGEAHLAFDLAARGLARSAANAEALETAERAALRAGEHAALSALYDLVAACSLGRFGRRAAHYRGARFFERSGDHALALKHAAQAFYAVPSEGATFQFLARAAERADNRPLAVRIVEQVAESEERANVRARWLLCAANLAGDGEDASRRKVEVLLRAAVAQSNVATVTELGRVAGELVRACPEESEGLELRLGHAARSIGARLEGPEGARVSLAFAVALLDLFGDVDGGLACVERAFARDADVEDYERLLAHASLLAQAPESSRRVATMLAAAEGSQANAGVFALRLLGAIGAAAGDQRLHARARIAAALREPDDDALVIEADEAIRAVPELSERIGNRIPPERRAAALVAAARAHVLSDAHGDAAALFERAADLLDDAARAEVERELRTALDAAGRRSEIEARAHRDAAAGDGSPSTRADGWTEVAELREGRGDRAGALQALLEACRLDPEPLERWSALERVAEAAGDDETRIVALEKIVTRVRTDGRPTVLKRLARAHERRGDLQIAEQTWQSVLALDSEDEEADQGIQSIIVARGDYEELARHLAQRAERLKSSPDKREMLRAVRLRRAAILEQRLGRSQDAREELELLLREWPDSVGALRYLADLLDRQSDFAGSVALWRRAAILEENAAESEELELRAAFASRATGDLAAAHNHAARILSRRPSSEEALTLRIEAARALGADADLGDALDAMAAKEDLLESTRADVLLESAQAAVRAGDLLRALDRARRAEAASPDRPAPRLLARALEYRMRGAGAPDEARLTIEDLSRIGVPLGLDDAAQRAFLVAEALDVVQGGNAGLHELEAARAVIGDHPLLSLGLAERFASQGQDVLAAEAYRAALAGPLLELRRPGAIALAAADTAIRAGMASDAAFFLDVADQHEDARSGVGPRRARLPALAVTVEPVADLRLYDLEAAVHAANHPVERACARLALARGRLDFGDVRGAEPLLWEALADGLAEAGDALAPLLASVPGRSTELVRVRWQQHCLEPGDVDRLESLRAAALADDDRIHARAIEHVLRAFDVGAGPLPPPPLAAQPEQPGILALLARPSMDASGEALALLWEGATQLFVRDAVSYGITGVERVVPGASSPIARLCEATMRVLGAPRIPVFAVRSVGAMESHVALLSPPSVILAADVRVETTALRFELGRGIAAALPHNVLRNALPKAEGRAVVDALRAAFGPPELGRQVDVRAARLAESFWQMISARAQRRLQELLRAATFADYSELVERARQSGRRVGMFLAGDFAFAARSLLLEAGGRETPTLGNLRALCAGVPALADLLCLAVRSEYAHSRWHSVASASQRRTPSSGRFSLF